MQPKFHTRHYTCALLTITGILTACSLEQTNPSPAMRRTPSGIQLKIGDTYVEAAAASAGAFRLSIRQRPNPNPLPSTFLSPDQPPTKRAKIHEGRWTGVRTPKGDLLIDPLAAQWTLRDPAGHTLIPPAAITETQAATNTLHLQVGCAPDKPFQVYGCGDADNSLLHTSATSHLGNGHATIPYYYNPTGYAALAVADDDRTPASWQSSTQPGSITWTFPGTSADLYLLPAPTLKDAATAFATLTGHAPVPPRWTFGYLQSRWGWKDQAYIDDTLHQFQSRHLPIDAFIFDFEWYTTTPDYSVRPAGLPTFVDFSFNPILFPHPADQSAALHDAGLHVVAIRKPRLGNSALLDMAHANGWILPAAGSTIDARSLDFSIPAVRAWYAAQTEPLLRQGIDGWWNDEGEMTYTTYYWWNQAELAALAQVHISARPWSLNRAFTPGLQRLGAAAWTGDIHSTWADLAKTPTTLLNWQLAGMPYTACDVGGFTGNVTPELLTRWMQAAVFFPLMRAHSTLGETPHFPWLFGKEAEAAIHDALTLRYRLIPYYYSLAHETHDTGIPLMRPLAMEFPNDPRCQNISDEWLMGKNLLAAPILHHANDRTVYLPAGEKWIPFNGGPALDGNQTLTVHAALHQIPLYVRAGTILPLAPIIEHTADLPGGPLELRIYPGKDATFTLIEDDGTTTAYLHQQTRRTTFTWADATQKLTRTPAGPYAGPTLFKQFHTTIMSPTP
jgi:alpha-glucosidase